VDARLVVLRMDTLTAMLERCSSAALRRALTKPNTAEVHEILRRHIGRRCFSYFDTTSRTLGEGRKLAPNEVRWYSTIIRNREGDSRAIGFGSPALNALLYSTFSHRYERAMWRARASRTLWKK
jgi:hypothetical protein